MTRKEPTFTIGIEEEYLLVDRESRASPHYSRRAWKRVGERSVIR